MGGGGDLSRPIMMKYHCESHYTQWKHNRNRKCTSVQKSEHYKTLMLMLLGEITFVTGPDCIFCKLVRRMRLIGLTVLVCHLIFLSLTTLQWSTEIRRVPNLFSSYTLDRGRQHNFKMWRRYPLSLMSCPQAITLGSDNSSNFDREMTFVDDNRSSKLKAITFNSDNFSPLC
jgi:hypothetical protein